MVGERRWALLRWLAWDLRGGAIGWRLRLGMLSSTWAFLMAHVTLVSQDYRGALLQASASALLGLLLLGLSWRSAGSGARALIVVWVGLDGLVLFEAVLRWLPFATGGGGSL